MAKQQQQHSDSADAVPTADDLRAAVARIKQLEDELRAAQEREQSSQQAHAAELEQARSGFKLTSKIAPVDGSLHKFKVSLQYAPTAVVAAVDPANAYQVYKETVGLVSTQYEPEICQVPDEEPLTYPDCPISVAQRAA